MTATSIPVGPPPPYDLECGAVLAALPPFPPLTVEAIPFLRAAEFIPRPTDEELARGGAFAVEERTAPGPAGEPDVSPYAAPARADDLSGLPPTFIDVGSADTFRDEDVDYATRIWHAGGVAELHVWPGGYHGFDGIVPRAALSKAAVAARATWLRRLLGP